MRNHDPHLAQVVGALAGLWQAATLYPPGHPARVNAADRRSLALRGARDAHGDLVLDLAEGCLATREGAARLSLGEGHLGGLLAAARERGLDRVPLAGTGSADLLAGLVGALAGGAPLPPGIAAPGEEPLRSVPAGPKPETGFRPLLQLLANLWGEIAAARRFADEDADRLVRGIAALPGDGLVEPVRLVRRGAGPALVEHSLDVARLTYLAGRALGLEPEPLREATLAAALADVGMLEVPEGILGKKGSLSAEEFRLVRRHPVIGAEMLLATPGVPDLAGVVAFQHHQRRGGGGYPAVPSAGPLHPVTRIVQVADVYTALRSPRTFRPEIAEGRARAILERLSRTWLDREMLRLVLERVAPLGLVPAAVPVPA